MGRLFEELKRRNVFRAGIAYIVAAWVLLQVAELLVPILTLPDWTLRFVFLLLAIGFIPALILSWAYDLTPQGLKRDDVNNPQGSGPQRTSSRFGKIVTGIVALALIGSAGFWFNGRDARWAREEAFPQIEKYVAQGEREKAHALAKRVAAVLPGDERLDALWQTFSWRISIPSTPPGAMVFRRAYAESDAEWESLGRTPLHDIYIPLGFSLLRLELDGQPPLLRVIGGETGDWRDLTIEEHPETSGTEVPPGGYDFDTYESLPEGMVRVPGDRIMLGGQPIELSDFFIGRYEVTNREFKAFVDAGGYQRRDLWKHEFVWNGKLMSWEKAIAQFTDRTGRTGPSTWQAGNYPDGEEDHPVAGVSWYEAAAYAKFVRRDLPTVHHWRRAIALSMLTVLLPASNLQSERAAPVGKFQGVGWTGTYDMAGNVREWCFNSLDDQRVILGGGWNDDPYMVLQGISDPAAMPAFDRSPTNGFRLAQARDDKLAAQALSGSVQKSEELIVTSPVTDEVFAAYLGNYMYDKGPLNSTIEETLTYPHWTRERISISSVDGKTVTLYLYLPNSESTPYQTILYWPTGAALLLDSIDQLRFHLGYALKNGRAVAVPVVDGTFERRRPAYPDWATIAGRDLVIQAVKDMRRSIDYLETRADIDSDALAFYGYSWGGRLGAIALVVEPRFKVGILNQAGLQHLVMPETSVVNFLPRVKVPVLQFNGLYDTDFRFDNSAKPFFDLIGTAAKDKKHVVEATGHFVSYPVVIGETLDWLDKYLGPPN